PYIVKLLLDTLQSLLETGQRGLEATTRIHRIAMLVLAVGGAGFVASLFPGVRGAVNVVFDYLIRKKYFGIVMSKGYRFFANFRSGDVVTRLTDDIFDFPKLSWFLCSGIFRAVESISKVMFCLGAMLLLNWKLTLLSLIPLPLMIAVFVVAQDRIYDTFRKNQESISNINAQLEMSFSGVRVIKAYACESKYGRFFSDALARRFGTEMDVVRLETVLQMIYMYIDYVMQIGIVFAGGYMAVRGLISIGTFYAFYNYLGMLVFPILDIPQLFVSGKRAFVNIDRLEEMRRYPDGQGAEGRRHSGPDLEGLAVDALSFAYEGRERPALESVRFDLKRGEKIAVIGPVGSGKSTLIKMLCGLLEPDSGRILVNGRALSETDRASLAALVGYVPQEALLFSGTIRENIGFGGRDESGLIEDAALDTALGIAQMKEEVAAFRNGPETLLGQRGIAVSGGQRQRLAIARAVARSPRLLLLDDITASLDAGNEERLMRALNLWSAELSCVVVSHRLSTLQYVDRVLFLDGGKQLGFGRHEELLESNPAYRAFVEEQLNPGQARA
ncbi:MAG TPA: ABC transporter ATP-binding protein, partial [Rectinemataceae bacterium]|nr:ABC transporter ATP-binding protein [Rectinemataceae bacterium]